jgi:MFS family permease
MVGTSNGAAYVMLPIHTYVIGKNMLFVGVIASLPFLALAIMSFGWGAISDHIGKRRAPIIIGSVIGAFVYFILPYFDVIELVLLRAIQVFFLASWILMIALITEYLPEAKGKATGDFMLFLAVGWVAGGAVSGFIYSLHVVLFFFFCGVTTIASAYCIFILTEHKKPAEGLTFKLLFELRHLAEIRTICIVAMILFVGTDVIFAVFPVYLATLKVAVEGIGVVIAASGVTTALIAGLAGNICDKYGRKPMLLFAIGSYLIMWILFSIVENLFVIIVLWLIPVYVFFMVSSTAMVSDLTDEQERGRGIGLLNTALYLGAFAGSVLGGVLTAVLPFRTAFAVACVFIAGALLIGLRCQETLERKERM